MCVDDGPLDVVDVSVVLEGPLKKTSFLAELSNVGLVVVCEHLVTHDGISNLRKREREREREERGEMYQYNYYTCTCTCDMTVMHMHVM